MTLEQEARTMVDTFRWVAEHKATLTHREMQVVADLLVRLADENQQLREALKRIYWEGENIYADPAISRGEMVDAAKSALALSEPENPHWAASVRPVQEQEGPVTYDEADADSPQDESGFPSQGWQPRREGDDT